MQNSPYYIKQLFRNFSPIIPHYPCFIVQNNISVNFATRTEMFSKQDKNILIASDVFKKLMMHGNTTKQTSDHVCCSLHVVFLMLKLSCN